MDGSSGYPVPASRHRVEASVRRSRFIATVGRASTPEEAREAVAAVRSELPDATHHCWAFVAGPPGSTVHVGASDDGEPSGTAGRPILQVLLHADVGDVVAVVTRYYGGTKLGTGGLARAYSGTVQQALEGLRTETKVVRVPVSVEVAYEHVDTLRALLDAFDVLVGEERYRESVSYELSVPRHRLSQFEDAVRDGTRGSAAVRRS